MRIPLNLSTKPLESQRKFLAGSGILGVAGVAAFLILGWHVYSALKADAKVRAETSQIRQQMDELSQRGIVLESFFKQEENKNLHERAAFLNTLIDARSFDWTQMFIDLERILPSGVRVVSIEPKQERGHAEVKITVGATSDEAKIKFLKALEGSKSFTSIELLGQTQPTQNASGDQVIVELRAVYSRA
jgi:type IV pilus assembly protein PilN